MHYYHFSVLFSRDHDLIFSWSRHNESCGSQRKHRFLTTFLSYREKIPHLVNVSAEYYGVRASGWYLHHKVTNFLQQIWTLSHRSKDSLQFDIQIYLGYKYAVRCHRHANNTEWHSPWFVNSYDVVDWRWNWLHVQGRCIVFDDTVANPTASFSSVEHLCVSRQSLTDTELFQFEWVPDQSKSEYDHPWCCDDAASIAFSHAEYTETIKSWSRENKTEKW